MIKLSSLKPSDLVYVEYEGEQKVGTVTDKYNDGEKEVCVSIDGVEYWFEPKYLHPIPLDEAQLIKLGFTMVEEGAGVKYMNGPFRIRLNQRGDFSNMEIWYREDRRLISTPIYVHELQNHYLQMTKMELNPA